MLLAQRPPKPIDECVKFPWCYPRNSLWNGSWVQERFPATVGMRSRLMLWNTSQHYAFIAWAERWVDTGHLMRLGSTKAVTFKAMIRLDWLWKGLHRHCVVGTWASRNTTHFAPTKQVVVAEATTLSGTFIRDTWIWKHMVKSITKPTMLVQNQSSFMRRLGLSSIASIPILL